MQIKIEDARPGMVLIEDILMNNGMVLVNSSKELDKHLIEIIAKRAITILQVLDPNHIAVDPMPLQSESLKSATNQDFNKAASPNIVHASPIEQPVSFSPKAVPTPLIITISDDAMIASCGCDVSKGTASLTADEVLDALVEAGVIFGINESKVALFVKQWNKEKKSCAVSEIAVGMQPTSGQEGEWEVLKQCVDNRDYYDRAIKCRNFWELDGDGGTLGSATIGEVIAQRGIAVASIPGTTVKGGPLVSTTLTPVAYEFDKTVSLSKSGNEIVALVDGIVWSFNRKIGVFPISFDGTMDIIMDPQKMKAAVVIHKPGPGGKLPDAYEVKQRIIKCGITFGVKQEAVDGLVKLLDSKKCPGEPVLIAAGEPATQGIDGIIEYLFNTTTSLAPKQNSDGSVDFKNVDIVRSMTKGSKLAQLIPPTKGINGTSVMGKTLLGKDGIAANLPMGVNTILDPENASILLAETAGNVVFNGSLVEICEGFAVHGDVDFSTGNINYAKSVIVDKDIKSGFDVTCGGDLEVFGTVEDSQIKVTGNVLCKQGFLGNGKGIIEANGDVNIGFLKNQSVKSRKGVVIAKESLNATIYARQFIAVYGKPLSVAGGLLVARDSITVFSVGNASQIKTSLEVGLDFTIAEEIADAQKTIEETQMNKAKFLEPLKKMDQIIAIRRTLPPKEEFLYTKLKTAFAQCENQIKELEAHKKELSKKLYGAKQPFIRIEHSAMPGTLLKIGDRFFPVREEIVGPKIIRMVNAQIKVV